MQRMLTGVTAVALALGVWACSKNKGPVNPDSEAQVTESRNAETRTYMADAPAASATPTPAGTPADAVASAAPSAPRWPNHNQAAMSEERIFWGSWRLKKRDGTILSLWMTDPYAAGALAEYDEAGGSVKVRQRCRIDVSPARLSLDCMEPEYLENQPRQAYMPDRLLFVRGPSDRVRVFDAANTEMGRLVPIEVLEHRQYERPPMEASTRPTP
ncbi:MAG: hypothetical protein LC795_22440 [Acidobacteria bacterium]|nr:hypothetical protein [Acidobacteriota bacterium]